ncbi:MAG TPA: CPBP family intramembrane glutamic endopeptidase [Gemmatimonadales bacterium]
MRVGRSLQPVIPHAADDRALASELRGFGPGGIIALIAILFTGNFILPYMVTIPIGTILVLIWARLSRTPWSELGLSRPPNWTTTIAGGISLGIGLKLLLKAVVMPLLGADPVNRYYHFIAGNPAYLPGAVWTMLVAGFGEELVYRGYLFERWRRLFGWTLGSRIAVVLVTSVWFGLSHYFGQGRDGALQSVMTGLTFGTVTLLTGRIWVAILAHTVYDLAAAAMIYGNLEVRIAHLFFR